MDVHDFAAFQLCVTGSGGGPVDPECMTFDAYSDGDVDGADLTDFKNERTGPIAGNVCGPLAVYVEGLTKNTSIDDVSIWLREDLSGTLAENQQLTVEDVQISLTSDPQNSL